MLLAPVLTFGLSQKCPAAARENEQEDVTLEQSHQAESAAVTARTGSCAEPWQQLSRPASRVLSCHRDRDGLGHGAPAFTSRALLSPHYI